MYKGPVLPRPAKFWEFMVSSSSREDYRQYRRQLQQRRDEQRHGAVLDGNDGAVRARQRSFATLLREYLRLLGRRRIAGVLAVAALPVPMAHTGS